MEEDTGSAGVTPVKNRDSDSSQYIRTDIKTAMKEEKHSPSSIITESMASKVGIGSAICTQEEAKAAIGKLNRKSASTH